MSEDSGDKTEEPTPHKLQEARDKGQIAKSKEFTSAILLFVSFYTFKSYALQMWGRLVDLSALTFSLMPEKIDTAIVGFILMEALKAMFILVGPIFLAVFFVALFLEALQAGFLITLEPLMPKLDNLNPINGIKKFFSLKQYVELIKSVIKMALVTWVLYAVIVDQYFVITQAQVRNLWLLVGLAGQMVMTIVTRVGLLYLFLALLDYFYQRYEFVKSMRMSKKEIKEEYKRLEGDPTVKQRQREAQRAMSQGRQMGAVPGADVVVTNPIHVAVALKYEQKKNRAPIVVAKGKRLVANEIRKIAEEHYIPIIESPPLARALAKKTEVGDAIPSEHFRAVAEILAFVYHLKKKRRR